MQATPEELNQLTSIATVQTKGLKRIHQETNMKNFVENPDTRKINSICGSKRKRLLLLSGASNGNENKFIKSNDPNVVGVDSSSSDDSESDDNESDDVELVENGPEIKIEKDEDETQFKNPVDDCLLTNEGKFTILYHY